MLRPLPIAQFRASLRKLFSAHWLLIAGLFFLSACGNAPEPPLDADTRQRIDSTSASQIRNLGIVLDSQCQAERAVQMPLLMDSIRKVRLREIEEKLRTVPR